MLKNFFREHPAILSAIVLFIACTSLFALHEVQASQKIKVPAIVGPNGSGTNSAGTSVTILAGRGTGTGAPGDVIIQTGATGTTGSTLQTATERLRITGAGYVGIGTASPTGALDVNGDRIRIRSRYIPASATAPGNSGDVCWDANHVYVCKDPNVWVRTITTTW